MRTLGLIIIFLLLVFDALAHDFTPSDLPAGSKLVKHYDEPHPTLGSCHYHVYSNGTTIDFDVTPETELPRNQHYNHPRADAHRTDRHAHHKSHDGGNKEHTHKAEEHFHDDYGIHTHEAYSHTHGPPQQESVGKTTLQASRGNASCRLGWSPQSQHQHFKELPKVMIYALEFEWDPARNEGYSCKTIEIRTGDDAIENLAGWKLYLGTLYNPGIIPITIPEAHSQITDRILRLTPEMLGLETFPCNTVDNLSHPLPGVHYVLWTDENVLVDTAYSCFGWGQNAYTTVKGVNVKSPRSVSSTALRAMETPRLERYILDDTSVGITYMRLDAFAWDHAVLSDWLLAESEETDVGTPNAPSRIPRKLVTTWSALKK